MIIAAYVFTICTIIVILFQFALAAGMPWGHLAMGGRFAGVMPPAMRVGAIIQAALLAFLAMIVLARSGTAFTGMYSMSTTGIWVVVAINGLSLVMNLITPSKWERILWSPVVLIMTVCSLLVALN
ncbi:MAG: hypothetical protein AAF639_00330 [Chloroflexota bacterium]